MTQKTRFSDTSPTGKDFREEVQMDLRDVVNRSDPMLVMEVCLRQMIPTWEKECGSWLQAAKLILQLYKADSSSFSQERVANMMLQKTFPQINAAAQKAVKYAEGVMNWTDELRLILRLNKPHDPLSRIRSKVWDTADEAVVATLVIRAVFDQSARGQLAAEVAEIVGRRSPTRAKNLLEAIKAA